MLLKNATYNVDTHTPSKITAWSSQPTCKNCLYDWDHYNGIQYCSTETVLL